MFFPKSNLNEEISLWIISDGVLGVPAVPRGPNMMLEWRICWGAIVCVICGVKCVAGVLYVCFFVRSGHSI